MFFGTSAFAVPSLERLAASHAVVHCITQPDRPQGRGLARAPSPVKVAAQRLRLPLVQPARLRAEDAAGVAADIGVAAAYGQFIPKALLALPAHGMLGVHPSLLPKYRGAAPVAWAIVNGEATTGVTIFRMNERLDAGEVVAQEEVAIEPHEDAQQLTARLARLGAEALLGALERIAQGQATFIPQDESRAIPAPKLTKAHGRIDWARPAEQIVRLVRATVPWPGAWTEWRGGLLKIWAAVARAEPTAVAPGTVARAAGDALAIAAGGDLVELVEVQPAGRRRMRIQEFLAGHRIDVGERFGTGDRRQGAG